MSRLLILTRPELAAGFHLAGVDAVGAIDVEDAQEQLETWLQEEEGLVAIDEALLRRRQVCSALATRAASLLVIPSVGLREESLRQSGSLTDSQGRWGSTYLQSASLRGRRMKNEHVEHAKGRCRVPGP